MEAQYIFSFWVWVRSHSYLSMQHACAVQYCPCDLCGCTIFFHIVSKMAGFSGEQFSEHKICFDFIYKTLSEIFLILRIIKRSIDINVYWFSCKVTVILSDCNKIWIFSTHFRQLLEYEISRKSVQWKPNCFMWTGGQTDRRTDMTKLRAAFRNFWVCVTRSCHEESYENSCRT